MKQPSETVGLLPPCTGATELPVGRGRQPTQITRRFAMSHVTLVGGQRPAWRYDRSPDGPRASALASPPDSLLLGRRHHSTMRLIHPKCQPKYVDRNDRPPTTRRRVVYVKLQPYDAWYDPNEIDETNHAHVLRSWFQPDVEITHGRIVLLGETSKNQCARGSLASANRPTSSPSKCCSTSSRC